MHLYEPEYYAQSNGNYYPAILRFQLQQDGVRDIDFVLTKLFTACADWQQAAAIAHNDYQMVEQHYQAIDVDLNAAELMLQHFIKQGYFPVKQH